MIRVTRAKSLGYPKLEVTFSDGSSGVADLLSIISKGGYFADLLKTKDFDSVRVGTTIERDDDLDIAPETLYALVHGFEKPASFEQALEQQQLVSVQRKFLLDGAAELDASIVRDLRHK